MSILITGGTGSMGRCFIKEYLKRNDSGLHDDFKIYIISRNENNQYKMKQEINSNRVKFILFDCSKDDIDLLPECEHVIHFAAYKHVSFCEENPEKAIANNINGTLNIIKYCKKHIVNNALLLSTDKAQKPINTYGATKMLCEKLWMKSGYTVLRCGNYMGSDGSVLPLYVEKYKNREKKLNVTDKKCVRYWMNDDMLYEAIKQALAGYQILCVPELKKFRIIDLVKAFNCEPVFTGLAPGEKIEEELEENEDADFMTVDEIKQEIIKKYGYIL